MIVLALLTVPLAWGSWHFIEQPFRKPFASGGFSRRSIFVVSSAAIVAFCAIGIVPIAAPQVIEKFYTDRLTVDARAQYKALNEVTNPTQLDAFTSTAVEGCRRRYDVVTPEAVKALLNCTAKGQRAVIVTGGSHAIDLYVALSLTSEAEVIFGFSPRPLTT
jgi:hypothetical protein